MRLYTLFLLPKDSLLSGRKGGNSVLFVWLMPFLISDIKSSGAAVQYVERCTVGKKAFGKRRKERGGNGSE